MADAQQAGILATVSTELAKLHRENYGKGPRKVKTSMLNDTLICILEGGFTIVERTLIDQGQADSVHDVRLSFQKAMEPEFRRIVERATGREVIAYLSQIHHDPDLVVDLFVLAPGDPLTGEYEQVLDEG
jgi:uncharacterized protein YbcI